MHNNDYAASDGLALAGMLYRKEVCPDELMRCAISLAQTRAPALNALRYPQFDAAQEYSEQLTKNGTLTGTFGALPFLLKDSGLAARAFPTSNGSRLFADTQYDYDATLVQRFDRLGLIPFARTAVPELCMAPTTEALANGGPTRNPWDLTRSAGGSSGGAAAAVAAGIVPLAHGSDGGGSIRTPAASCGLVGLKASRGRIPMGPLRGEGWGGLACEGVLSRSVRDTAAALDGMAGWEAGAPYAAPPDTGSYLEMYLQAATETASEGRSGSLRPLRIGVWREAWNDIPIAPECLAAVECCVRVCRSLGHEVVDTRPPALDYSAFVRAHIHVLATNIVLSSDARLSLLQRPMRDDDLEPATHDGYALGKRLTAAQYAAAIQQFHAVGRSMQRGVEGFDLILSPTLTQLPLPLDTLVMDTTFIGFREQVSRYATFLAVSNASGHPAISVPLHRTASLLPVGVHFTAHFGREDVLIRIAAELETALPWAGYKPVIPESA